MFNFLNELKEFSLKDYLAKQLNEFWLTLSDDLFDICIIAAIIGVFVNMFGYRSFAKKLTGLSILAAIIFKVVFNLG